MLTAYNVPMGPYGEGKRSYQASEGMKEWFQHGDPNSDPLFGNYFEAILRDQDALHRLHDHGVRTEVWNEMHNHPMWSHEPEKVNMNRFMSFLQRFEKEEQLWHMRLLAWLYVSLQIGLLKRSSLAEQGGILRAVVAASAATEGSSTARADAELKRLRGVSKNQLHLGILLYSDPDNLTRQRCIQVIP